MLMQNFGVRNKERYGMLGYFLEWSIVPSQSFMENVLLSDVHLWESMFVSSALRTVRYTALMGAPPKVQPSFC